MAVVVFTNYPYSLLDKVRQYIDENKVRTWAYDSDGDFFHTPDQWNKKAWFTPKIEDDKITFHMIPPRRTSISVTVYAVYHGRFIEMLLKHCDRDFTLAYATSMPAEGDVIS